MLKNLAIPLLVMSLGACAGTTLEKAERTSPQTDRHGEALPRHLDIVRSPRNVGSTSGGECRWRSSGVPLRRQQPSRPRRAASAFSMSARSSGIFATGTVTPFFVGTRLPVASKVMWVRTSR